MPLLGELAESSSKNRKDYLHLIVDESKYRSTFHAMRNPDTVKDDSAFRALRKDSSTHTDPENLGIFRDANIPLQTSSCWKHNLDESLSRCSGGGRRSPTVFYPNRNNKVMESLSQNALIQIKKQSLHADAGDPDSIITYEDLIKDPDLMEAIKYNLGLCDQNRMLGDETDGNGKEENLRWKGKTLYELFHENHIILRRVKSEIINPNSDENQLVDDTTSGQSIAAIDHTIDSFNVHENVIVQMCIIDHNAPSKESEIWKIIRKKESGISSLKTDTEACTMYQSNDVKGCPKTLEGKISVVEELQPNSTSAMRALEREDSSSTEDKHTTIVFVPNSNNTNTCDKKENADVTICEGELESLESNFSLMAETDDNVIHLENKDADGADISSINMAEERQINLSQETGTPLEVSSSQTTEGQADHGDEICASNFEAMKKSNEVAS
jgi:hypothetical protein